MRNDSVIRARIDSMTMEERKKFTELFFGIRNPPAHARSPN